MTAPSLIRLCYISESRLPAGPDLADSIAAILRRSKEWNESVGITGALFFNRTIFAQVLEGPFAAVEHIFERIRHDPRHGALIRLDWRGIDRRDFGDWAMAFVGADAEDNRRFADLGRNCPNDDLLARDQMLALLLRIVVEREGVGPVPEQTRLQTAHGALDAAQRSLPLSGAALDAVKPPA